MYFLKEKFYEINNVGKMQEILRLFFSTKQIILRIWGKMKFNETNEQKLCSEEKYPHIIFVFDTNSNDPSIEILFSHCHERLSI